MRRGYPEICSYLDERLNQFLKQALGGDDKITLLQYLKNDTAHMVTLVQRRLSQDTEMDHFAAAGAVASFCSDR